MKKVKDYLLFMLGLMILAIVGVMVFVWEGIYQCYQGLRGIGKSLPLRKFINCKNGHTWTAKGSMGRHCIRCGLTYKDFSKGTI